MIKNEYTADIATLEQESRQMRARMERLEAERDELLTALEWHAENGKCGLKYQYCDCPLCKALAAVKGGAS